MKRRNYQIIADVLPHPVFRDRWVIDILDGRRWEALGSDNLYVRHPANAMPWRSKAEADAKAEAIREGKDN